MHEKIYRHQSEIIQIKGNTCWNLVNVTPTKLQKGFWWNVFGRLDMTCRCAWTNIITVEGFLREIIQIMDFTCYNLESTTPPKPLKGLWWNLKGTLNISCRSAWSHIKTVSGLKKEIIKIIGFKCKNLVSATPPKPLKGLWWNFIGRLDIISCICRCTSRSIITIGSKGK